MAEDLNYTDRILPHNKEAEESVLGSALVSMEAVVTICELLRPQDFFFAQNKKIFEAISDLFNENIPVDMVTVSDRLNQNDVLEEIGGVPYLSSLIINVPTTENVEYYSKIIKDKAKLRRLIYSANNILSMAYGEEDAVTRIIDSSEKSILDISSDMEKADIVHIGEIMPEAYDNLVSNSLLKGKITGVSTGFDALNSATGGLHGGELIIVAGRPGMGKSSFAVNIAEYAAITEGTTVAIFNLEMSKSMIVNRIICSQALIDSQNMKRGDFAPEDWVQLSSVIDKLAAAPIYIDDKPAISVREIKAKCRRLKQTKNLGMIVIDYLQLMQSDRRVENRQTEISEISRELKIMAKELNVPVIALSQLSRTSETRKDKRPMLSDLRESGAIEQDADIVLFLYRDEYYNNETTEKNIAEVSIAKQRSGSTGIFKLGWQGRYTKFVNIDYSASEN